MKWVSLVLTIACATLLTLGSAGCAKKDKDKEGKGGGGGGGGGGGEGTSAPFTMADPGSHSIKQDSTAEVKVSITRKSYEGDVKVTFENLPKGVTLSEKGDTIAKGKDSATFTLKAAKDAPPVADHAVTVKASGGDKTAEGTLKLTVKGK
jgi:hypothetical protein